MKRSITMKLFVVVLVGALVHMPALGQSCNREGCPYPPLTCIDQLLYDAEFDYTCGWSAGDLGYSDATGGSAEIWNLGRVWQDISVPSGYSSYRLQLDFYVSISDNANAGTERLAVEIVNPSTLAVRETVATIYPNAGNTRYQINTANYAGETIRVNFRYYTGQNPGGTDYSIPWCYYFVHSS